MKMFTLKYRYNKQIRIQNGMDSDFSHYEIDESFENILSPNKELAEAYLKINKSHDKEFKIIGCIETDIHTIIGIDHGLGFRTRD